MTRWRGGAVRPLSCALDRSLSGPALETHNSPCGLNQCVSPFGTLRSGRCGTLALRNAATRRRPATAGSRPRTGGVARRVDSARSRADGSAEPGASGQLHRQVALHRQGVQASRALTGVRSDRTPQRCRRDMSWPHSSIRGKSGPEGRTCVPGRQQVPAAGLDRRRASPPGRGRARSARPSPAGTARAGRRSRAAPRAGRADSGRGGRPPPGPSRAPRASRRRRTCSPAPRGPRSPPGRRAARCARPRPRRRPRPPRRRPRAASRPSRPRGTAPRAVLPGHREHPREQVAEVVGEVRVDAPDEGPVREVAVRAEGHLAHQEVAQRVHAVAVGERAGVDDVADGLGHLAPLDRPPAVREDRARRGDPAGVEHRRPVDRVRGQDVLADEVVRRGPEALEARPSSLPWPAAVM